MLKERIITYENSCTTDYTEMCNSCIHFKGANTCVIHTHTWAYEDENVHMYRATYLNRKKKVATECNLPGSYAKGAVVHPRSRKEDEASGIYKAKIKYPYNAQEVLAWMKDNNTFHNMNKEKYGVTDNSFLQIMDAIALFYEGKIDELASKHEALVFNSRQNTFYSKPFNRFTGAQLFTALSLTKHGEKELLNKLKLLSPHAKLLRKAMDIVEKHLKDEKKKDMDTSNFMFVVHELLIGDFSKHGHTANYWPYIGKMGEMLMEWGDFSKAQFPNVLDKSTDSETKQKRVEHFRKWAHISLTNQ